MNEFFHDFIELFEAWFVWSGDDHDEECLLNQVSYSSRIIATSHVQSSGRMVTTFDRLEPISLDEECELAGYTSNTNTYQSKFICHTSPHGKDTKRCCM